MQLDIAEEIKETMNISTSLKRTKLFLTLNISEEIYVSDIIQNMVKMEPFIIGYLYNTIMVIYIYAHLLLEFQEITMNLKDMI